ncbi:hypothetical protein GCM10023189_04960 [Nibrella saemangeumensis]|uniref:Uncharacterized protein n=1 Tax=Nibrella saemangeumensis TaxID=1084526 RepID=A0ABP8MDU6_9BACT
MRGTIIHYDELTRCGLVKDTNGSVHYFRSNQLVPGFSPTEDRSVLLTVNNGELLAVGPDTPAPAPITSTVYRPQPPPVQRTPSATGLLNWPGFVVSLAALVAMFFAGGEVSPLRNSKTPPLIESVWAIAAAGLLALEAYWFANGAGRWKVRLNVWPIALCSLMAYWMQSCDGFEPDTAFEAYTYLLLVLFLAAYLLPYQRGNNN